MVKQAHCEVCNNSFKPNDLFPLDLVDEAIIQKIEQDVSDLDLKGSICLPDLQRYQLARSRELLEMEVGQLDEVEEEVLANIRTNHILAEDINEEYDESLTFGQRMADHISEFGGSWRFIGIFFLVLLLWMAINTVIFLDQGFDPYPYILLNLVLSCLAAIQAPIIMMSQNRQAQKDRISAENDYKVNLKTELLIFQLTAKVDHLMKKQWLRMLEHRQMHVHNAQSMREIQDKLEGLNSNAKTKKNK
jgi:uncharacterized membrane protein